MSGPPAGEQSRHTDKTCLGFSSNTNVKGYSVEDEKKKLTIEEMNGYVSNRTEIPETRGCPRRERKSP